MSFSDELREYVIDAYYTVPGPERQRSRWVMDAEWLTELRRMTTPDHHPMWEPSRLVTDPDTLLGRPIEVREGGGAPHLETS